MRNSERMAAALACFAFLLGAPSPPAALTLRPTDEPYRFGVEGSGNSFVICGRSAARDGQRVYLEYVCGYGGGGIFSDATYNESRDRELKELFENGHLLLADEGGRLYEPTTAYFVGGQYVPGGEGSEGQIIAFSFVGEFSGELRLAVKLGDGGEATRPFGPADKNYYRRGTVTAEKGLDFRIDPFREYAVAEVLKAGDTFHLTGVRSSSYVGEERENRACFYEVVHDGREGWVAYQLEGEEDTFFTIGDFDAF